MTYDSRNDAHRYGRLPGADLVERGLRDLRDGTESTESLLVSIGAPKLRSIGVAVPAALPDPERRLYLKLKNSHGDGAHSQYNALIRRLVAYERARCVI